MEKRVLLAIILSFIVLYGYQALFPPKPPQRTAPPPTAAPSGTQQTPPAQAGAPTAQPEQAPEIAPEPAAVVGDAEERDIRFENEAVTGVFSTRGAVLKSWRLKKYQDTSGRPLELVPQDVP